MFRVVSSHQAGAVILIKQWDYEITLFVLNKGSETNALFLSPQFPAYPSAPSYVRSAHLAFT